MSHCPLCHAVMCERSEAIWSPPALWSFPPKKNIGMDRCISIFTLPWVCDWTSPELMWSKFAWARSSTMNHPSARWRIA